MMERVGKAKGSNMHHMRSWVLEGGKDRWELVLDSMAHQDSDVLRALLPVGWYELDLQHRLLRAIDETLGDGDGALVRTIGRFEANLDLTKAHRLFLRLANPAYVLEKAGSYWGRFYDTGQWHVERKGSKGAVAELTNVDPFDPMFAEYLSAYIERMWELVGARDVVTKTDVHASGFVIQGRWS